MVIRIRLKPIGLSLLLMVGVYFLYLGFAGSSHLGKQDTVPPKQQREALQVDGQEPLTTSFFVNFRQNRETTRQQQIDLLNEMINNPNVAADTRKAAQAELLNLNQVIAREAQVEGLVLAKGFKDVAAQLSGDSLNLMVYGDRFTPEEITKLQDIAVRATGIRVENIVIIPRK